MSDIGLRERGAATLVSGIDPLSISPLSERPSWVSPIALWHHNEWLRAQIATQEGDLCEAFIQARLAEREQSLRKHADNDALPVTFVAHDEVQPLGTVSLVKYQFTKGGLPTEWLTNLYVVPECRGCGIASLLMDAVTAYAQRMGFRRLLLYTADQAAFYKKRRWRTINRGLVQGQSVDIMDFVLDPHLD